MSDQCTKTNCFNGAEPGSEQCRDCLAGDGKIAITGEVPLPARGLRNFGCPACGRLFTLPAASDESPPFCLHHDSNYHWRQDIEKRWTQTVPVTVQAAQAQG